MTLEPATDGGVREARWQAIDVARGAAVVAMIAFHFVWDLSFLRLIEMQVIGSPFWGALARIIAGSFLLLAGIGLVLAHPQDIRWPAYGRRLAGIAGAAIGVTLATWLAFPDSYIFFGILHCITLSSVLALPFLHVPVWLAAAAALLCFAAPLVLAGSAFDVPALTFLGLGTRTPVTNDYVPLFPWFGVMLVGVALARTGLPLARDAGVAAWPAQGAPMRALVWCGRHSLAIYLVHQPILFGALSVVAYAVGV